MSATEHLARTAHVALVRRLVGDELRAAAGWAVFYALIVWASAAGYATAYPQQSDRLQLEQTLGHNAGLAALFGRPDTLATIGGFTAWRSEGVLLLVGSVWGMFLGARLFRGIEESGRWEFVLAGRTDRRRAARDAVIAAVSVLAVLWAGTAAAALAATTVRGADFGAGAALLLATQLLGPAALFAAVAAVAAQVFGTRRQASAAAAVVFGALFCLRLSSGTYPELDWLRVINPLQWFDSARPLTASTPGWLLAGYGLAALLAAVAVELAGRRDLDGALIADRPPRHPRPVTGVAALGWRLTRAAGAGWVMVAGALAAMIGVLAGPVGKAATESSGMRTVLQRVAGRAEGARAFLGLTMITISMLICLCAAALVSAIADEETSGRLERLLAAPVRRLSWLAGRTAGALVWLVGAGLVVGVACWATASGSQSLGLGFATLVNAGLNLVPVAALVLAVGVAAYAVRPRWAGIAAYALVATGFGLELVGSLVRAPGWLLDLSVFHHLALAPATSPRWGTNGVLLLLAAGLMAAGALRLRGRDLAA